MKKQQKEKIKKSLLTTLHVVGYVCIGLTLIMGIMVGVNSCNNTKQVNAFNTLSLNDNVYKSLAQEGYDLNSLNNYDVSTYIKTEKNSVYYFNGHTSLSLSNVDIRNYRVDNGVIANCGLYIVNFDTNNVIYTYCKDIYVNNSTLYVNDSSDAEVARFTLNASHQKVLFIFEDERFWYVTDGHQYEYMSYNVFNDILIYCGNTFSSQDYGNEYKRLNYTSFDTFISNYWVNSGVQYLYPFVLPQDFLDNNKFLPISSLNQSNGNIHYFQYLDYVTGTNKGFYAINGSTAYQILSTSNIAYNQVLGIPSFYPYENNLGYSFITYCGCYNFSNLYKNFLSYSFVYNGNYSNYTSYYVDTNLNYKFNAFDAYRHFDGDSQGVWLAYSNADLIHNGKIFTNTRVFYQSVSWTITYGGREDGDFDQVANVSEPMVELLVRRARYSDILNTLKYAYDNDRFTRLLSSYNTQYTTPSGDINSSGLGSAMDLIGKAFSSIASVLNLQIFGAFTLGSLVFIPLVVTIVLFIIKMFKR